MTTDLDRSLSRLGATHDDPRLDAIDVAVLRRVRADRTARWAGVSMACTAAVGAVMLGLLAADPWRAPATTGTLSDDLALAPSTLLAGR